MKYLLAHDLGTSGDKVTLFTTEGKLLKSCVRSYGVHWFNDVWAEQIPDEWFEAVCGSTKEIMEGIDPKDVLGVSFSGQMMGCVCVDERGNVLRDAIIWADRRATEEEAFITGKIDTKAFYDITGHRPSASNSMAKLLWLKNNEPKTYEKTYKMLNAKDYILLKLTGAFVTDYSDASGTNLLDLNTLQWSVKIADAIGLDLDKMPELKHSTDVIGVINETMSQRTGLNPGTPIVCGGGDGSMAALGAGCVNVGDGFTTVGTSAWNALTTESPILDDSMRIFNFAHIIPGKYVPCGTMQTAGAAVGWMVKELAKSQCNEAKDKQISVYDIMNALIESTPVGSNGVIFLPYLLGERSPRWNNDVRGCFIGLKMDTQQQDMFRSVYEGVAMNLELIFRIFNEHITLNSIVMTGGGAMSEVWCQIFADLYNVEINVPDHIEEATSIGAAVTAGVGIGIYKDFNCIHDFIHIKKTYRPISYNVERYKALKEIFDQAYYNLLDTFKGLSVFTSVV